MSANITGYRIFIASPSGLDEIRRAFREEMDYYNRMDALRRGVMFVAVGWEETLGGPRRPQSLINDDLRTCDAFVLVLRDRWGSPPDIAGRYSSGCEEEFAIASESFEDEAHRLSDILVFFQAVAPAQLADPGSAPAIGAGRGLARRRLESGASQQPRGIDNPTALETVGSRFGRLPTPSMDA